LLDADGVAAAWEAEAGLSPDDARRALVREADRGEAAAKARAESNKRPGRPGARYKAMTQEQLDAAVHAALSGKVLKPGALALAALPAADDDYVPEEDTSLCDVHIAEGLVEAEAEFSSGAAPSSDSGASGAGAAAVAVGAPAASLPVRDARWAVGGRAGVC
jgi:hypothetical protein